MDKTSALILAAGKGTRMNSRTPKVLCEVLEKPMLFWVLDALKRAKIKKQAIVLGNKSDEIKDYVIKNYVDYEKSNIVFSIQNEQKGTADAVKAANFFLKENKNEDILICNADSPLLDEETIVKSYNSHKKADSSVTIITAKVENPQNFGRIVRNEKNEIIKIVEEKDASLEEKKIKEINSGMYWFKVKDLINTLEKITPKNKQNEFYLTDSIDVLIKQNKKVNGFTPQNENIVLGVNTKEELFNINVTAKEEIIKNFIKKGVNFISTDGVLIYPDVEIKSNVKIFPGSIIKGKTKIGENSVIGPNSLIENSVIGENCKINSSQVYNSEIENFTTIGPFCHIRPNSKISHNVKIGDFVEVKNSKVGAGTAISHLTYVGDSDVGKNVNFGCGVVTINYDGVKKSRCVIEDGCFIGCNTNLVAPVKLGKNCYTGAGSTITKDVPENALAIERTKQQHIENFSKTKLKGRKLKVK